MNTYIFDFDGTLVNSIPTITYFANNALNKYGLPSISEERYKKLVGNGAVNLVKRMLKEVGADPAVFDDVYKDYYYKYDENFSYLTEPYEGILDMLKALKKRGCKTAIVSNKPHDTTVKICNELFGDLIDLCRGQMEGCPIKPDPTAVIEVIKELGAEKEQCVYCGDTITDMETGKNAGLYTIGVLWGFRDLEEIKSGNPDKIVSKPEEILDTSDAKETEK
mgnify:CR=1 FL=1